MSALISYFFNRLFSRSLNISDLLTLYSRNRLLIKKVIHQNICLYFVLYVDANKNV